MSLVNTSLNEIHASLKVQRVVPDGADVFRLTRVDDVEGLKRLFCEGLASPHDIHSQTGENPLSVGCILLF